MDTRYTTDARLLWMGIVATDDSEPTPIDAESIDRIAAEMRRIVDLAVEAERERGAK